MKNYIVKSMIIFSVLFPTGHLPAHEIHSRVSNSDRAVVIEIEYPDGRPFSFEEFEVFAPGENEGAPPFHAGRTDSLGRILFLPNRAGIWLVKFRSQDGHGGETKVDVAESGVANFEKISPFLRFEKMITGIGILLGITGLFSLYLSRRTK